MMRYTPDGYPDYDFGDGGVSAFLALGARGYSVGIANDQGVFAAGGSANTPVLVSANGESGLPRFGFGNQGVITLAGHGPAGGLVVDGNQLYVAYPTESGLAIAGFSSQGQPLTSFGTSGVAEITTPAGLISEYPPQLLQQPDGKFLAAVATTDFNQSLLVYRLQADGSLDNSWSGDGLMVQAESAPLKVNELTLQPDGKLVVVVSSQTGGPPPYIVAFRYQTNGDLDPSYGVGGRALHSSNAKAGGAYLGAEGSLWLAGQQVVGNGYDLLVAAWDSSGTPDAGVGNQTYRPASAQGLDAFLYGLQTLSDESWLAWGTITVADSQERGLLMRLDPSLSLASTFGLGGFRYVDLLERASAFAIAEQADGKIVSAGLLGYSDAAGGNSTPALARFLPDGSPDTSFGSRGVSFRYQGDGASYFHSMKVLSDQRIFAAGRYNNAEGFLAARFLPDGTPDPSFDANGFVNYRADCFDCATVARAATVDNQGKYLLAGEAAFGLGNIFRDAVLSRLTFDGLRDSSFGNNGVVQVARSPQNEAFNDVVVLPDDDILACGSRAYFDNTGPRQEVFVMRFRPNGLPRNSFGDTAVAAFDLQGVDDEFTHLLVQADGKILVAYENQTAADTDSTWIGLLRLESDGDLDPTFGDNGWAEFTLPSGRRYSVSGITFLPGLRILLSGRLTLPQGGFAFLAQYDLFGQLIPTFADSGVYLIDEPAALQPNGGPFPLPGDRVLLPTVFDNVEAFALACLDLDGSLTGLVEAEAEDSPFLQVFPNPSQGPITVTWSEPLTQAGTLTLLDGQGRSWQEVSLPAGSHRWQGEVEARPSGVYLIRLQAGDRVWTQRWLR